MGGALYQGIQGYMMNRQPLVSKTSWWPEEEKDMFKKLVSVINTRINVIGLWKCGAKISPTSSRGCPESCRGGMGLVLT